MSWFDQPRTLALSGSALPQWLDEPLLVVSRVKGTEELGKLYQYDVELSTLDDAHLSVHAAQALVDLDRLAGKEVTLSIAIEGNGTWVQGATSASMLNVGADVRKITGVIAEAQAIGADDRRAFYRFRLRPRLWIATLNRDSRTYQNRDIKQISSEILNRLSIPFEFRLTGPFLGKRGYPARDYQRQWWESDYELLDRLWQEWGITYFYDDATLVLCDSPGSFKQHGPAYRTVRYLDRGGQRIDEEHVHAFNVTRRITTGKVSLVDYDYTQSVAKLTAQRTQHSESTQDNAEEYAWGDYAQPLATPLGVSGRPNDAKFEAEHLAQVKVEAHRAQSRLASGSGNLRGLMTGHTFRLEGYPLTPGDGEHLVVSTELEIVNNDTVTNRGTLERRYQCETHFTAVPADTFYRTPQTAVKPRAHGEMAVVVGFDDQDKILTDPYGRVKVHFVWDRVSPLNDTASCWLQVASPWQGPGYGALWTPRVGQMVQIGYFDSDPDRPFVVAAHSTENHQLPWELPRNSVLSGWRSRDLQGQSANSVLTDDTPGKLQVQVASDHAQSRLVLGSNTRIDGHKGRSEARGVGFELATEAHGVLRANAGLLMTTEARTGATAPVKDMGETVARLTQARGQHEELGRLAQQHLAQTVDMSQADAAQAIKTQNEAIKGGAKAHDNPSPEMTRPDAVLASSAGIATTAAESTHQASGEDHAITAARDMSLSLGRSLFASVRGAISMFAYQLGLKLIAAKGKVEIQAQSDQMALQALKDITVSSTDGKIVITASKEVWIGAGGSYVQINGSGITNGSPGAILEKGASWSKDTADAVRLFTPTLPNGDVFHEQFRLLDEDGETPLVRRYYEIHGESGAVWSGYTDNQGLTERVFTDQPETLTLKF
ncbi:Rhs element Vgr protein [Burkholderia sp. 8Y]|uniref:type VI secretion system Vgr family protein n=1 Tax=Burkholderia sp. 8Y TaxID=2653133 RepID=UPI0012F3ACF5|nr:type VI secretion system Vgr family protein [Burkholderia sp. 8Y]VXB95768.1 Rhs element Vgr protein [Burkholderia sp. 8Y]